MASAVVYENVTKGADLVAGKLFAGKKFWVAQRVPHRATLLHVIEANGGSVVKLEKLADWMIADHFRKDCPPGTISYDFIHKSIAKGEVLDPNDFPAGPRIGTARDPGSMTRPSKGTRASFTPEDDRILYKWAKDAQSRGAPVSGNEIYKKLEEKHPQHPWQSWRDRYVKKLQFMPPFTFNISDNAPPSPPSDHSARVAEPPVVKKTVLVKNKDKARAASTEDQLARVRIPTSKEQTTSNTSLIANEPADRGEEYTVEQLAATFTTEDWESLYAFVEEVDSCSRDEDSYERAWTGWAEDRENQTAQQWRQYYEKVVRPQWLRDPVSKREQIKKRVVERLAASPAKSQSWSQTQDSSVVTSLAAPSALIDPLQRTVLNMPSSDSGPASESTAQQETPRYIRDGYESALKRVRGGPDDDPETNETPRPAKIRRGLSQSPTQAETEGAVNVVGTQEQPLEIGSSAVNSSSGSSQGQVTRAVNDEEEADSIASDDDVELFTPFFRPTAVEDDEELESVASSTDLVHIAPLPRPPQIPENEEEEEDDEDDEDDEDNEDDDEALPSNSPTPRATRFAAFDTQAILSPSQTQPRIPRLPRPNLSSSPPHHPESDASTTQSLQEFSSYLQGGAQQHHQQPVPRPASPSPSTTSTASSAAASSSSSEDPDAPLSASEMDDFFSAQQRAGFSNAFITAALKRTRCRPGLATAVLEAWRKGDPLPERRGVWSVQEDEAVRAGDGAALAALTTRHTLDGWGGVTERVRFLHAWETR
ncbi:transcription factor [Stagonosporopsis vannaccii]|nr:transcription factor [Stagonosporopsis vannaccii]